MAALDIFPFVVSVPPDHSLIKIILQLHFCCLASPNDEVLILILFLTIRDRNANTFQGSFCVGTNSEMLKIKRCPGFKVTGNGSNESRAQTEWMVITPRRISAGDALTTKRKALYSETGIYLTGRGFTNMKNWELFYLNKNYFFE